MKNLGQYGLQQCTTGPIEGLQTGCKDPCGSLLRGSCYIVFLSTSAYPVESAGPTTESVFPLAQDNADLGI